MTATASASFDDLERAAAGTTGQRRLAAGDYLFHQGDRSRAVFGVIDGAVRLTRTVIDGRQVVLHRAEAGSTFAEAALFSDIYHCDAVADCPSTVAVFPIAILRARLGQSPELAMRLAARLARQVQSLRSQVELRNIRTAEERVLAALALRCDGTTGTAVLGSSLKLFAAEIGLTHEALYRSIAKLEQAGRIERNGREIRIFETGRR